MYNYCVIRPNDKICGGNPATDEKAAKKCAEYPTGCCVEKMTVPKKEIKRKRKKFFRKVKQNSKHYTVDFRKSFETKEEADDFLWNEAAICGHFVKCDCGWRQNYEDLTETIKQINTMSNSKNELSQFWKDHIENSRQNDVLMRKIIDELKKTIECLKNRL